MRIFIFLLISMQHVITWPRSTFHSGFVAFPAFRAFYFSQAEQKWKKYRDQGRLTFLAPLHQTPSRRIALPFVPRARDSAVSLLEGYVW